MKWYYFIRRVVDGEQRLYERPLWTKLPPRPADANPMNGDPLTPWYMTKDHTDEKHVHVRAESRQQALLKSRDLLDVDGPLPLSRYDGNFRTWAADT